MEATRDIRFNDLKNTFSTQHLFNKTKGDKVIWAREIAGNPFLPPLP
jgi:hypothetical protein